MKRLLLLTSMSLPALFAVSSAAQAAPVRAATQSITSSTTPKRDRTAADSSYCAEAPGPLLCFGVVTVTFKKGAITVSSRRVHLNPDCTYRSRISFRYRSPLRHGPLRVLTRFAGNLLLLPLDSAVHTIRAG